MIKADKGLQDTIALIRERIHEYLTDGILDATEQNMLDSIITQATSNLDNEYGGLMDLFKDDEDRQASQKGFSSMSQDSANELNGRFAMIQTHTYSINENVKILTINSGQVLKHLANIERNTASCLRLDEMEADLKAIKNSVSDMALKGILIKK
jgi:hypothetical protein